MITPKMTAITGLTYEWVVATLIGSSRNMCTKEVKAITDPKITKYPQASHASVRGMGMGSGKSKRKTEKLKMPNKC
jgi:hypothetical protein